MRQESSDAFPPDQKVGAFSDTAISLTVSPLLAQGYETAAEQLASRIETSPALSSCDTATIGEDACATQFIATFGRGRSAGSSPRTRRPVLALYR